MEREITVLQLSLAKKMTLAATEMYLASNHWDFDAAVLFLVICERDGVVPRHMFLLGV